MGVGRRGAVAGRVGYLMLVGAIAAGNPSCGHSSSSGGESSSAGGQGGAGAAASPTGSSAATLAGAGGAAQPAAGANAATTGGTSGGAGLATAGADANAGSPNVGGANVPAGGGGAGTVGAAASGAVGASGTAGNPGPTTAGVGGGTAGAGGAVVAGTGGVAGAAAADPGGAPSQDGAARMIFSAEASAAAPMQLAAVDLTGGRIEATLFTPDTHYAFAPKLSPDGSKVAYLMDSRENDLIELYVSDVSGPTPTPPVRVNDPMDPVDQGEVFDDFVWSPDSTKLLYVAAHVRYGARDLFLADVSGPAPGPNYQLNASPSRFGAGPRHAFTQDTSKVLTTGTIGSAIRLFMIDVSGPTPAPWVQLHPEPTRYHDVSVFCSSPDGRSVAFAQEATSEGSNQMWMVDLLSPSPYTPVKVHEDLDSAHEVEVDVCLFSHDGRAFVYKSSQVTEYVNEFFMVPVTDGVPGPWQRLGADLAPDGSAREVELVKDGTAVVFSAWSNFNTYFLFYADLTAPDQPTAPVQVNVGGMIGTWLQSPDGREILYKRSDTELYWVDIAGPTPAPPIKLSDDLPGTAALGGSEFSPDQAYVAFWRRQDDGVVNVYSVDMSGPAPASEVTLTRTALESMSPYCFDIAPASDWLLFQAHDGEAWKWYLVRLDDPSSLFEFDVMDSLGVDLVEFQFFVP